MLRLLFAAGWLSLATAAPQGLLDGLSNLLTSVVGGSPTGEVDNYESAPYTLVRSFDGYEERFYPSQTWVRNPPLLEAKDSLWFTPVRQSVS